MRSDFPMFARPFDGKPLIYLDNAATTQKPQSVIDALVDWYGTSYGSASRGLYALSTRAADRHALARGRVQEFIGAQHAEEIIFTKHTTEAINIVAQGLGPQVVGRGDEVLITGLEHHANMLPWRFLCEKVGARLVVAPTDSTGHVDMEQFHSLAGKRTRFVAVAHISNVLGTTNPVAEMVAAAHAVGAPILVDGAQAVARRSIDVRALDADFYCFSGHKMYGPTGVGVLYGKAALLDRLSPPAMGGGIAKEVSYQDDLLYMPLPWILEAGTLNVADAVGLHAAIDYLVGLDLDWVAEHDAALVRRAVELLSDVDQVEVVGEPGQDPGGIVSFVVSGIHPYDVGDHLNEHGIAVRTGVHCAIPFVDGLGLVGTVRMSFGVYNTDDDVDAVADALRSVAPGFWTREHPSDRYL